MTQSLSCIKATNRPNFNRIYVKIMNLGNNIKLDILKLVFCFKKKEYLDHVTCCNSFLTRRGK